MTISKRNLMLAANLFYFLFIYLFIYFFFFCALLVDESVIVSKLFNREKLDFTFQP